MKKTPLVLASLCLASSAFATDWQRDVLVIGQSVHSKKDIRGVPVSNDTAGVGIAMRPSESTLGVTAGLYRNSFRDPSAFVAGTWYPPMLDFDRVRVSISLGAVSGYHKEVVGCQTKGIAPMGFASVDYRIGPNAFVGVVIIPPATPKEGAWVGNLHAGFAWR